MRNEQKLTQSQMAQSVGISLRYMQMIESGSADIRLSVLKNIAQVFKIESAELLLSHAEDCECTPRFCNGSSGNGLCVLNVFSIGLQIANTQGLILFINEPCEKLLGYSSNEVSGKMQIWDFLDDADDAESLKLYFEFLTSKKQRPIPFFTTIKTKSGIPIKIRQTWNYFHDEQGAIAGFISELQLDTLNR